MRELLGDRERRDIERVADRVLRDIGNPEPPLNLDVVREVLRLDLKFYQLDDPTFAQELAHRVRVAGRQIAHRPGLLIDVVRKANLSALWLPDTKRILIDGSVPQPKHRWVQAHEIGHSIIPWHGDFLFGDNEQTLDPACHAIVEAEANYGAGRLLFLGDRFATHARDLSADFASVQALKSAYQNTLTSTLWRFIESRDPAQLLAGMVGQHPRHEDIGHGDGTNPWRYFVRSAAFAQQFSRVTPQQVFALVEKHASWKKRGPIVDTTDVVYDDGGTGREFRIESFSNTYDLLTLMVCTSDT